MRSKMSRDRFSHKDRLALQPPTYAPCALATVLSAVFGCSSQSDASTRLTNGSTTTLNPTNSANGPFAGQSDAGILDIDAPDPSLIADSDAVSSDKPCPDDMVYVDTTYCAEIEQPCIRKAFNRANKITICREYAETEQKCLSKPRRQRFCIDRYEFPNREGAHPPVMVDWYDASALCQEQGKRLCWESEWVAACEGPAKTPFPYGYTRDPKMCNIDNSWLQPSLAKIYSRDMAIRDPELFRLDQSVSSGERPACVSGFGVYDLTGNVDEWVNAEKKHRKSRWAGLKGGAWGHVRNACRPMTVSHEPSFTYYFVSFRCCADAAPDVDAESDSTLWKPPSRPAPKKEGALSRGWIPKTRAPHQPPPPNP